MSLKTPIYFKKSTKTMSITTTTDADVSIAGTTAQVLNLNGADEITTGDGKLYFRGKKFIQGESDNHYNYTKTKIDQATKSGSATASLSLSAYRNSVLTLTGISGTLTVTGTANGSGDAAGNVFDSLSGNPTVTATSGVTVGSVTPPTEASKSTNKVIWTYPISNVSTEAKQTVTVTTSNLKGNSKNPTYNTTATFNWSGAVKTFTNALYNPVIFVLTPDPTLSMTAFPISNAKSSGNNVSVSSGVANAVVINSNANVAQSAPMSFAADGYAWLLVPVIDNTGNGLIDGKAMNSQGGIPTADIFFGLNPADVGADTSFTKQANTITLTQTLANGSRKFMYNVYRSYSKLAAGKKLMFKF